MFPMTDRIDDVDRLEDLLSEPTTEVIGSLGRLSGDILVLGAGGKMGPTLARMAGRALDAGSGPGRVIAVSRFSNQRERERLESHGVETIVCDLLDLQALEELPEVPTVIYMVGMKFGSTGNEARTWAVNAYLPAMVCRRFSRSRIVAFSTGNVYPHDPGFRQRFQRGGSSRAGRRICHELPGPGEDVRVFQPDPGGPGVAAAAQLCL